MSSSPTSLQVCRDCGGGAPVDAHFCPQCEKILSLGRHGDYFAFMGLPRRLTLEAAELERRFRSLSRQFHPDFFYNATPAERRASLDRSSYLNDAYRTLRDPVTRLQYLLRREPDVKKLAEVLVNEANARGGDDNIGLVLARVPEKFLARLADPDMGQTRAPLRATAEEDDGWSVPVILIVVALVLVVGVMAWAMGAWVEWW